MASDHPAPLTDVLDAYDALCADARRSGTCPNCGESAPTVSPICPPIPTTIRYQAACDECYDGAPDSGAAMRALGHGATEAEAIADWREVMEMACDCEVRHG